MRTCRDSNLNDIIWIWARNETSTGEGWIRDAVARVAERVPACSPCPEEEQGLHAAREGFREPHGSGADGSQRVIRMPSAFAWVPPAERPDRRRPWRPSSWTRTRR
ncbi:hypothetical protein GCM10010344_03510 [Streptomyces bluensis]|nr:hypothetical protein GCM10010344_03510 [Streptomyces bluensis]